MSGWVSRDATTPPRLMLWVEPVKLAAGVVAGESPADLACRDVSHGLPCDDLVSQLAGGRNAAVEALATQNAQFDLGDVQPAAVAGRVMNLQPLLQPVGLGRRERLIQ